MEELLRKLAQAGLINPFDKDAQFEEWNQFDIAIADFHNAVQVMRNLLCGCTKNPRRTQKELDNMIQKIREAN